MQLAELVWLVPLFPLLGFLTLMVIGRRLGEPLAGWLATGAMGASFLASVVVFIGLVSTDSLDERFVEVEIFDWVVAGDFSVDIGLLADPLSVTMILFITGVATLIHLYSIGYMHGDPNFSKFFIYLNMFAFSMLLLVLGDNLLLTFLGWEGVGACSYFLISFWFGDEKNASAGKKAFVTNRVGDFGFMLATFLAFFAMGTINYGEMAAASPGLSAATATGITLLLFVGAAGKSAQFPLYLWLPDAMAGPTPVSALIHAATMVTSGIYLLSRVNPIIHEAHQWAPSLIAWVGLFTAIFAATIAVGQNDIKKVLAYSTVSQLGFMVVAVGTGFYVAALFHMITHAFFKALLFLGSGSVIHGMHDDQDMRNYGGLYKYMPVTAGTFIVGTIAIAGIFPFSGFWSKDEILVGLWDADDVFLNKVMFVLLLGAAALTAFYMTRLVVLTFFGKPRWRDEVTGEAWVSRSEPLPRRHPHESPWQMTVPLMALAGLAFAGGFINMPFSWGSKEDGTKGDTKYLEHWLEPSLIWDEEKLGVGWQLKLLIAIIAVACAAGAMYYAWLRYNDPDGGTGPDSPEILEQGWGYDNAVTNFMGGPGRKGFEALTSFDRTAIDGAVNGVGKLVRYDGQLLRKLQSGLVRSYALLIGVGAIALMAYFLIVGAA